MKTSNVWTGCVALAMATAMSDRSHAQIIPPPPEVEAARETVATRVRPELEPLAFAPAPSDLSVVRPGRNL